MPYEINYVLYVFWTETKQSYWLKVESQSKVAQSRLLAQSRN